MQRFRTSLVYAGLALLLTQLHGHMVNFDERQSKRVERHQHIIQGTGKAPWVHRQAVPQIAEAMRRVTEPPWPSTLPARRTPERIRWSVPLERSYLVIRFASIFTFFLFFHAWLRTERTESDARTGTLWVAALHGPSFANYWFQPSSSVDLVVWTAGAVALQARRDRWLWPLMVLGAVNRETSLFLVVLYVAFRIGRVSWGLLCGTAGGLFLVWSILQGAIRMWVGPVGWAKDATPMEYLTANVSHPDRLLYAASFFGVLWILPALRWRQLHGATRRLALALMLYAPFPWMFGRVAEVRLWMPMALLLVPVGLDWWNEEDG